MHRDLRDQESDTFHATHLAEVARHERGGSPVLPVVEVLGLAVRARDGVRGDGSEHEGLAGCRGRWGLACAGVVAVEQVVPGLQKAQRCFVGQVLVGRAKGVMSPRVVSRTDEVIARRGSRVIRSRLGSRGAG